jgi:hypothetical protein
LFTFSCFIKRIVFSITDLSVSTRFRLFAIRPTFRSTSPEHSLTAASVVAPAGGFFAGQGRFYQGAGTPHSGLDAKRSKRAVYGAGAAFHAGVSVAYLDFLSRSSQDSLGADLQTDPASIAFFLIECQGGYIG